jgi:hypothetical protein
MHHIALVLYASTRHISRLVMIQESFREKEDNLYNVDASLSFNKQRVVDALE